MNSSAGDRPKRGDRTRGRHMRRAVLLILGVVLVVGIIACFWYWAPLAATPALDLTGADAEVIQVVDDARRAVRRIPRSGLAWGQLGMVLHAHDFLAEARTCYAQAESFDLGEPRWPYYQGLILLQGEPDNAIPKLERAVELSGTRSAAPRLQLAEALCGQGRLDEAESHFQVLLRPENLSRPVLQEDWSSPQSRLGLARVAYNRSNWEESLNILRETPESPYTRRAVGALTAETCYRLGDRTAAAKALRRTADAPEDRPWPDDWERQVERLKAGKRGRMVRIRELIEQGSNKEGIALLLQELHDFPSSDWAWVELGRAQAVMGDYRAAERTLRQAVQRIPEHMDAYYYLGIALFDQGKILEAEACFRKATELKPDYAEAHYSLGMCRERAGNRAGAAEAFRMALRCKPHDANAHTKLAELFIQEGRNSQAVAHLREALELHADHPLARKLLAEVSGRLPQP